MLSLSALQSNRKVSFVIPVRVDSPERAQNLDLVVEQLMALKDSIRMEIRILEADEHPHYELKISDEHIHKTFVRAVVSVGHHSCDFRTGNTQKIQLPDLARLCRFLC